MVYLLGNKGLLIVGGTMFTYEFCYRKKQWLSTHRRT